MHQKNIILHLSLIDGVGPGILRKILESINFDLKEIYTLSIQELQNNFKISENISAKIKNGLTDKKKLNDELLLIEKNQIKWTTFIDEDYPYLLKNIHLPPSVIYWQGRDFNDNDKRIAIIGSRKANNYSKKVIDSLTKDLVSNNWLIVSGGALGADTMAHETTLNYSGKTIAVLGSGLLQPYPLSNKKLFQKILENEGTIVSSFPLNFPALPENFPARNRIISGISKGCIVVQAAIKSGTRITALHALEQGRDVFAVPGAIDDELSSGCNKLIQEGAKLVTCSQDILEEYGEALIKNENLHIHTKNEEINFGTNSDDNIISLCRSPMSIEEISEKTGITIMELQSKLFDLQLNGKLIQNFTGLWQS